VVIRLTVLLIHVILFHKSVHPMQCTLQIPSRLSIIKVIILTPCRGGSRSLGEVYRVIWIDKTALLIIIFDPIVAE